MKRRVQRPDLWANFMWQSRYYHFKNNFYLNHHLFNNFNFFTLGILLSFIVGFGIHSFWALTLSMLSYMVYAWLRTKYLAQGFTIRRRFEPKGREKEKFRIHYDISNGSGFMLPLFTFSQPFEGVQEGRFEVKVDSIPPQTRRRVTVEVVLSAGMGVKEIGDFKVYIHDELALFPYELEFSGKEEIEVYPLVTEIPQLRKSVSPDSIEFGFYDIQKRGESNLFIGTREYRHGDPVKHINWKLSRKANKLIINEFEKNTNTYVTLLLDLELSSQVGFGAVSTWEVAKDLALSIAVNEVKKRNYIQVLAQDLYVPFGTGEDQLVTIERHFTYHELSQSGLSHLAHLHELPSQSQIYFFCPMIATGNVRETLNVLKRLRHLGQQVTVMVLDPYTEIRKSVMREAQAPFMVAGREAKAQFEAIEKDLKGTGMNFVHFSINSDISLRKVILEKASYLIEEYR